MQNYNIAILVPGMPFDGGSLKDKSLGGSETAGYYVARELTALGHNVTVFSGTDESGEFDGVTYRPTQHWAAFYEGTPHDFAIVQRTPEPFAIPGQASFNLLWCHDLPLGRQKNQFRSAMWNVDEVLVLSDFMKGKYKDVYALPDDVIWQTRNGVEVGMFPDQDNHDPKRLIYSARPERGMDLLLEDIMPRLLKEESDLKLEVYGYDNAVDHYKQLYSDLNDKLIALGDCATFGGFLPKAELYQKYAEGGVYVYPTPGRVSPKFREISCISVMEAQASGLPVVTSAVGALPETLAVGAGSLIEGEAGTEAYADAFCKEVLRYVRYPKIRAAAAEAGREAAASMDWGIIAEEWSTHFDELFARDNDDKVRLAYHFYRRSDIFAARYALDETPIGDPAAKRLAAKIEEEYAFALADDGGESIREHYRKGGEETNTRLSEMDPGPDRFKKTPEVRHALICQALTSLPEIKRVLDYGCGHGWSTVFFSNNLPDTTWVGVDPDPGAIKWANVYAWKYGDSAKMEFVEGWMDGPHRHFPDGAPEGLFDAAVCSEVLEHCVDPIGTLEAIEACVKPGGHVMITVPYGPAEFGSPNWMNFRNHLWELDRHDLWEMFKDKKEMVFDAKAGQPNPVTGEMVGFYSVIYKADHQPLGKIDWERKLRVQRPRQTLAGNVIAGVNAERTMRWTLESLQYICDEIIVADCGLSDESRRIVETYGATLIDGADPIEEGFETPRNLCLDASSMDWVLWIDTDERLADPHTLVKYLRHSMWNGISIRQHHLNLDGLQADVDLPVRCFRTRPAPLPHKAGDGVHTMRFYGMIHEHPELVFNEGPGTVLVAGDVNIAHLGYLHESVRRARFLRNEPMLKADIEKYPDRAIQKHFIMRDNILKSRWEMGANGGVVTPEIRARCEENKTLWREHFHKKGRYSGIDPLPHYTAALTILGEGIDVHFEIGANREGVGDQLNGGYRARFADAEEAAGEVGWRLSERVKSLESKEW